MPVKNSPPSLRPKLDLVVIFGGASQEHDVSVISAQQFMDAVDQRYFNVTPVYMDFENRFFLGDTLRDIKSFSPKPSSLSEITFLWSESGPVISYCNSSSCQIPVDCIIPVLHGPFGEDGRIQSYFELLGIPVAGFSASGSAIAMRKDVTKSIVKAAHVATLEDITINRLQWQTARLHCHSMAARFNFPLVVKPANLGSSIGVGIARTHDEFDHLVERVLKYDSLALIEPKVHHLREFNIATMLRDGEIKFSAIESPKLDLDFLDFKSKYQSSGNHGKYGMDSLAGMLALSRDIAPTIPDNLTARIHDFASKAFMVLGARGCPRIDFLYDQEADSLWFNEINPIPGSYAFFLWEAAEEKILFPELITHLVHEAIHSSIKNFEDPVPGGARLLPR